MIYLIIPDKSEIQDWKSYYEPIKDQLNKDIKELSKSNVVFLNYNETNLTGNFFSIKDDDLIFERSKNYNEIFGSIAVNKFDHMLVQAMVDINDGENICVIRNSIYKNVDKYLEDKVSIYEFKSLENDYFLYINSSVAFRVDGRPINRKEKPYAFNPIHSIR